MTTLEMPNDGGLTPEQIARLIGGTFLQSHSRCGGCGAHGEVCAWWNDTKGRTLLSCRRCLPAALEQHMRDQAHADRLVEAEVTT